MFTCPKCKLEITLPQCTHCNYKVSQAENIWQLSDMPDMVTDGDGDKYIGYEHIGENYSGNRKYLIEEKDALFVEQIAQLTGDGIFLDLACGDGCFTVPCATHGTRIIAGDISNAMMGILQKKARHNGISLENVTLCRMNVLDIPLSDNSVDVVVAVSVLHLISSPEKVVSEIYRVLKKGGVFVCKDDRPGRQQQNNFNNDIYNSIVKELYNAYWVNLKEHGIKPQKYSWKFDRDALCEGMFLEKSTFLIERGGVYEMPLKDELLSRLAGRGFSDQANVPLDIHEKSMVQVMEEFEQRYGEGFANIAFKGIEEDILMVMYKK